MSLYIKSLQDIYKYSTSFLLTIAIFQVYISYWYIQRFADPSQQRDLLRELYVTSKEEKKVQKTL